MYQKDTESNPLILFGLYGLTGLFAAFYFFKVILPTLGDSITTAMVESMGAGSIIVDLAAERGGNCELSAPDERVVENGVVILGPTNLPSMMSTHASQMYGKNLVTFLGLLIDKEGQLQLDTDDEIIRDTMVTRGGAIVNERIRSMLEGSGAS